MRITVLQQMARCLPLPVSTAAPSIVEVLESVRRYLWHGNFSRALSLVEDLNDGLDILDDPPPEVRKLRRHLSEFSGYISNNAGFIPNYAERRRYGEAVSTAFVESTVNQVIAKRFTKKQQMQWTPRGVHLLMQLRTLTARNCSTTVIQALDAALEGASYSGHVWRDVFKIIVNPEFWLLRIVRGRAEAMTWTPGLVLDYARLLHSVVEHSDRRWRSKLSDAFSAGRNLAHAAKRNGAPV